MRSLLEQLQDDQAILLMYLADELPAADRAVIAKRLTGEPALRDELDKLRAVQAEIELSMARLDELQPMPASQSAVAQKFSRMLQQWHTERLLREPDDALRRRGIFARFAPIYPFVAAAAVIIGLVVWWGLREDDGNPSQFAANVTSTTGRASATADTDDSYGQDTQPSVLVKTETDLDQAREGIQLVDALRSLTEAEDVVGP